MSKKTILITGSGSGIGKSTAMTLVRRGHDVLATTHHQESADELQRMAKQKKLPLTAFKLDITDPDDRQLITEYSIDVLINNAGIGESGSLAEIPIQKIRDNFEVNVFGSLALSQLALQQMLPRNSGTIIFISSLAGRIVSMPFLGPYIMTKFALSATAEDLRNELRYITDNVHVSVVEPGAYHTGFNQKNIAKKYEWMDAGSYFYAVIDRIKRRETTQFRLTESRSLDSIVCKIVSAAEADKPKLRYCAPWWQCAGVRMLRMLGK